jgi:hypothetical protein
MNVIFLALELGAPSVVDVVETTGMKREMYPKSTVLRFDFPSRGAHPPVSIYWYDGNRPLPEHLQPQPAEPAATPGAPLRSGQGGMVWIGTKGSYPAGRGKFAGKDAAPLPEPPPREWGREEVHKDWSVAVKAGKPAPCHFGYAGPFTEAYQLGNVALRVGHRIEWDPKEFRVTNCREANQYLRAEYRRGWEIR